MFGNAVSQWGYRDDGDAGLLHVGARYYDPQVGRFISRDAALSEHPYLYCEHEPVNSVDPSGDVPEWLRKKTREVIDWLREYGSTVAKGATIFLGTITGINIAVDVYIVYKDWDCSRRMHDMLDDWLRRKDLADVRHELIDPLLKSHIRDAMRDVGQAAGDIGKQIYQVRPAQ
ncbi:MAG: hypothetical protein C4335_14105 [Armatimonadota bacterium]